jgi:hypothetical protein
MIEFLARVLTRTAQSLPGYVVGNSHTMLVQKPPHLKLEISQLIPDFQDVELMLYLVMRLRLSSEHLLQFAIFDTTDTKVRKKPRRFKPLQRV